MGFSNKNEVSSGNVAPNLGYINEIPTNTNNLIKATNFHNFLSNLMDWIFPGNNPPNDNSTLVAKGNYELSWEILMPIGGIISYAGSTPPDGWLLCDGSSVSSTTYTDLFNVIGNTFATSTPVSGSFQLPNLKSRIPVGTGSLDLQSIREKEVSNYSLGDSGGVNKFEQTENEMAQHEHFYSNVTDTDGEHTHDLTYYGTGNFSPNVSFKDARYSTLNSTSSNRKNFNQQSNYFQTPVIEGGIHSHSFSGFTGGSGSSDSMENRQPYLALNYIIKY